MINYKKKDGQLISIPDGNKVSYSVSEHGGV